MRPNPAKNSKPIELKLRIKSSLPNPKSTIGLLVAIWKAAGEPSNYEYSIQLEDSEIAVIDEDLFQNLLTYFGEKIEDPEEFKTKVNGNKLFRSQIESLIVAFQLIWRLGRIEFIDETKSASSERVGLARYPKIINFTSNLDILNLILNINDVFTKDVLYSWITGTDISADSLETESNLIRGLTILSEPAVYRLRENEDQEIIFTSLGIYNKIRDGTEEIDIKDYREDTGSLRILRSSLSEGLNEYLVLTGQFVQKNPSIDINKLHNYSDRVKNYFSLINFVVDEDLFVRTPTIDNAQVTSRNIIVFGAPGTGKSYYIEQQREVFGNNFERVTFHPSYSYGQFVGSYKPRPKSQDGEEYITYEYVPGPFLRLVVKAINNPEEQFLLIIEEINRANAAAVFGDAFQLLDRLPDGSSEYEITTSEEMKDYLLSEGFDEPSRQVLKIPGNLSIWATMNSADQGVYPIDSAFKRRWQFKYIGIDDGSSEIRGLELTLNPYGLINWDFLRRKINMELTHGGLNVNEDKLIGPFFLKEQEMNAENIDEVFKNKVILYLFEDVLKNRRAGFFKSELNTVSKIFQAYDEGRNVFSFDILIDDEEEDADNGVIVPSRD